MRRGADFFREIHVDYRIANDLGGKFRGLWSLAPSAAGAITGGFARGETVSTGTGGRARN